MTDEQSKREDEATPQGAVEIEDTDLDQAPGGLSVNTSNIEMEFRPTPKAPADPDGGGEAVPNPKWKL